MANIDVGPADTLFESGVPVLLPPPPAALLLLNEGPVTEFVGPLFSELDEPGIPELLPPPAAALLLQNEGPTNTFVGPLYQSVTMLGSSPFFVNQGGGNPFG